MTASPRLGFIGLGLMGGPIALKILQNGIPLTVWGRSAERLAPVLVQGAEAAASAADLAAASDLVFLCVSDTAAVEEVVFDNGGIAGGAAAGTIIVDHSTIEPDATRDIAARLEGQTGAHWLDAPVSGGARGVELKTLVVMAGGNAADFERVRPVVDGYAGRFTLMGQTGAGQTTKIINQALCGVIFSLVAEATQLAEKAGIDVLALPEALAGGRGDSALLQEYLPHMAKRDYTPRGRISVLLKDLDLVAGLAEACGASMPLAMLTRELNRLLVAQGHGDKDNAALMELFGG